MQNSIVISFSGANIGSSKLQKAIEKALNDAENLSQSWVSANYTSKQKLQYLVFPEGILYDKERQHSSNPKNQFSIPPHPFTGKGCRRKSKRQSSE